MRRERSVPSLDSRLLRPCAVAAVAAALPLAGLAGSRSPEAISASGA